MPTDFSAKQIRVSQLIASGGITGTSAGLVIYSASAASALDGTVPTNLVTNFGNDVFLFVSGTKNGRETGEGDVTLFGGDVVISGTLYADKQVIEVEEAVTGSLSISGSLIVSQSATIQKGMEINTSMGTVAGTGGDDFIVFGGSPGREILAAQASSNQVLILSGGGGSSSPNERDYLDSAFFVSGTIASRGSSVRGTSIFGGDTVISGSLIVENGSIDGGTISGSIHQTEGGVSYLIGGDNVTITSASNGQITITSIDTNTTYTAGDGLDLSGTTFSTDLKSGGGLKIDSTELTIDDNVVATISGSHFNGNVGVTGSLGVTANVNIGDSIVHIDDPNTKVVFGTDTITLHAGGVDYLKANATETSLTVNPDNTTFNTIINSDNKNAIVVNGATDQVLILSGGSSTSIDEGDYSDLAFFVSGTIGSRETSVKGTAVFGGDVVISGSINGGSPLQIGDHRTDLGSDVTTLFVSNIGGNGKALFDGDLFSSGSIIAMNTVRADLGLSGSLTRLTDGKSYLVAGSNITIASSSNGQVSISSTGGINGSGDTNRIAYWSNADTLTSDGDLTFDGTDLVVSTANRTGILVDGSADQVLILSGGSAGSINEANYADMALFVSGAVGSRGSSTKGVSVFGGDVVISGSLFGGSPLSVGGDLAVSGAVVLSGTSPTEITGSLSVTGSMDVTGSLTVSGSDTFTVYGPSIFNADQNATHDFQVKAGSTVNMLYVDSSTNRVGIGTGFPHEPLDVRGNIASTGYVSASMGISGSLTRLVDGTSYLVAGAGINIASASNGAVTITGTAVSAEWTDEGSVLRPNDGAAEDVGIGGTGTAEGNYKFYVDGATGSTKTLGFVTASLGFSGSLTRLTDERSYLVAGSNISITSASNGQVTISSTAPGTVDGSGAAARLAYWSDADTLTSDADLNFNGSNLGLTGSATGAVSAFDIDRNYAGTTSNSAIGSSDSASGILVDYDVTGVVAASQVQKHKPIWVKYDSSAPSHHASAIIQGAGIDIEMTGSDAGVSHTVDGLKINVINSDGTFANNATRGIIITAPGGTVEGEVNASHIRCLSQVDTGDYFDISVGLHGITQLTTKDAAAANAHLNLKPDGMVTILSGGGVTSASEANYADTNFFVSGTIGSRGTTTKGTSVFGGDVVISGTLYGGSPLIVGDGIDVTGDVTISEYIKHTGDTDTYLRFQDNNVNLVAGGSSAIKLDLSSGKIQLNNTNSDLDVQTMADNGAVIFHSDAGTNKVGIGVTEPEHVLSVVGAVSASLGLSGSLTRLVDGRSYLVAGSNITIASASNGQVTINSTGGGGTPGGSDTQLQYNNGGSSFGGLSKLTWDDTNFLLGASADTKLQIRDSGIYLNSPSDGKLNISADGQVLIMSGGGSTSSDESKGGDVAFFVSGSKGTVAVGGEGVSVFGGDVVVSGSSQIRRGFEINADKGAADFIHFGSTATKEIISSLASLDQVMILANTDTGEVGYADMAFFVSGTIDSRGTSTKGTSIFGGDLVVSGALALNQGAAAGSQVFVTTGGRVGIGTESPSYKLEVGGSMAIGEYIYHRNDANTHIRFEDDKLTLTAGNEALLTLTEDTQDIVTVGDGGDVDFQVRTNGDDNTLFVQGSSDRVGIGTNAPSTVLHIKESAPTVTIQREDNSNSSTLQFLGQAGATANMVHLARTNDLVFSTHDGSDQEEILRLGSYHTTDQRQVIMLSGTAMADDAMHPKEASDINFFVSGAIGSRGSALKGTAVFGGDTVVSGVFYLDEVNAPGTQPDGTVALYGKDDGGVTKLYFKNESGETEIGAGGGGGGISWDGSTANGIATYKDADEATVEANFTFDGTDAQIASTGKLKFRDSTNFIHSSDVNFLTVESTGAVFISGSTAGLIQDLPDWTIGVPAAGVGGGLSIRQLGTGTSLTAGGVYYLSGSGTWTAAQASHIESGSMNFMGIAGGSDVGSDMFTNGPVNIAAAQIDGDMPTLSGSAIYLSKNTAGSMTFTAPSGSGEIVKVLGHCIGINAGNLLVWFNPESGWIELS